MQHGPTMRSSNHHGLHSRGSGLHLKGAIRTTLTALLFAAALCSRAEAQAPVVQAPPGAPSTAPNSPRFQSPQPATATGGMTTYDGLIVRIVSFPEDPFGSA